MLMLVMQIVTGIWLAMSYKPSADDALCLGRDIMRDVDWAG